GHTDNVLCARYRLPSFLSYTLLPRLTRDTLQILTVDMVSVGGRRHYLSSLLDDSCFAVPFLVPKTTGRVPAQRHPSFHRFRLSVRPHQIVSDVGRSVRHNLPSCRRQ